jgi:hypothetical protein
LIANAPTPFSYPVLAKAKPTVGKRKVGDPFFLYFKIPPIYTLLLVDGEIYFCSSG